LGAHAPGVQGARGCAHARMRRGCRAPGGALTCACAPGAGHEGACPGGRWLRCGRPGHHQVAGPARPRRCSPAHAPCCKLRGPDARACPALPAMAPIHLTNSRRVLRARAVGWCSKSCAVLAALTTKPCLVSSLPAGEPMRPRAPGTSATTLRRASASASSGATAPARCPTAAARPLRASGACACAALRSAHLQALALSFASF